MAKVKALPTEKLHIQNEMAQVDTKNRDFFDNLTADERKKFSTFLMLKWMPSVYGSTELQAYYLMSVNETVNVNFFNISRHPKLQWLCCTAASPGIGKHRHYWLASKNKDSDKSTSQFKNLLLEQFPSAKSADIDTLITVSTSAQIQQWLENLGCDRKLIKEIMSHYE